MIGIQAHLSNDIELIRRQIYQLDDKINHVANAVRVVPPPTEVATSSASDLAAKVDAASPQSASDLLAIEAKVDQALAQQQVEQSQTSRALQDLVAKVDAAPLQSAIDLRAIEAKVDQALAQQQVEQSQASRALHDLVAKVDALAARLDDLAAKVDDVARYEPLRTELVNQMQDVRSQMEGAYATNHGDHIRLDVVNTNIQEIVASIEGVKQNVETMRAGLGDLNARVEAVEKAAVQRVPDK